MLSDGTPAALVTLFLDRGPTSLWRSLYNQGTGEGHELLNAATRSTAVLVGGIYTQVQHTEPMVCLVVENRTWSAERSRRRWARRPLWGDWLWWLLCEWCWGCRASWCNGVRSGHSGLHRHDHTTPITCSKRTHGHNHMTALAWSLSPPPTLRHYLQVIRRQRQLVWSSANDY